MNKFNIGDKVKHKMSGDITFVKNLYFNDLQKRFFYITDMYNYLGISEEDLELVERKDDRMELNIKYFDGATELVDNKKGNCIDVYAREDIFIPKFEMRLVPLGFAMQLEKGTIARLFPRSSTYKTWGVIQTNGVGIIDDTYCGDLDEWKVPFLCIEPKDDDGTWIRKGDKVAQFEIVEAMKKPKLNKVNSLNNESRGGFGSTGRTK